MIAAREFDDASALMAHYADLHERFFPPTPTRLVQPAEQPAEPAAPEPQPAQPDEQPAHMIRPVFRIVLAVAEAHHVTVREIIGPGRTARLLHARQDATAAVAQAYPRRSLPWLGRQLHRDHSTIHFALRKMGMRQHTGNGGQKR